ncbi:aminoglycoside phosphotransferase family protein [Thalassotalea euphylliae]|nr:phosphotransferase [Thalassotalea euphylliae]
MSSVPHAVPRIHELAQWLEQSGFSSPQLVAMTGDAGFRCYYRFSFQNVDYIAVDAPPKYCNNSAFLAIANQLAEHSINVPKIYAYDLAKGFFCLQDFGRCLLADVLSDESMPTWYKEAIDLLPSIAQTVKTPDMPVFDRAFVETELSIFTEWLLAKYLRLTLSADEQAMLEQSFTCLVDNTLEQPQVFMHRDFHSRNLMVLGDKQSSAAQLGVIDFQDAVLGPITYDVVSLLRDCYVKWPAEQIAPLFEYFVAQMSQASVTTSLADIPFTTWQRWFDLTGLQRHIKASGIFARLLLRDNKAGYIKDIPLTLSYIVDIASQYEELTPLAQFVESRVIPAVAELNQEQVS